MYVWGTSDSGLRTYQLLKKTSLDSLFFIDGLLAEGEEREIDIDGHLVPVFSKNSLGDGKDTKIVIASSAYKSILKEIETNYPKAEVVGVYHKRFKEVVPYDALFPLRYMIGTEKMGKILSAFGANSTESVIPWVDTIQSYFSSHYDLLYLESCLRRAGRDQNVNTVIVGSSYGLFGIDSCVMEQVSGGKIKGINCSLMSQDWYYSKKCFDAILQQNDHIENLVICGAYYSLFSDLSRTKNPTELARISRVYYPLFKDYHHCVSLSEDDGSLPEIETYDLKRFVDCFFEELSGGSYFNDYKRRVKHASKLWADTKKTWRELSDEEQREAAEQRAALHNRVINRPITKQENIECLEQLISECSDRSIRILWVVPPVTEFYRNRMLEEFREIFYEVFRPYRNQVEIVDLYDSELFVSGDFNDMDHLGDVGAIKLSELVVSYLK